MRRFYVSLVRDLLGYYLVFEAESERAVRLYLESEYKQNGVQKLPWCSVYAEPVYLAQSRQFHVKGEIRATCGPLYEEAFEERA
jgi:hypothetical protein